jgi:addiction module HigA family antidote
MNVPEFVNASPRVERSENLYRPHPGEVFARRCLAVSGLKQPQAAEVIGISTKHLSRFINGHVSVGVDLARKLEACTKVSAQAWLHYQTQYDLYSTAKLEKSSILLSA